MAVISCSGGNRAQALLERLRSASQEGKILYGHQDDLVYGHSWKVEDWQNDTLGRSDVRDVCGAFPAVVGFDLGGIELGDSCNLDAVPFGLMRKAVLTHVERGGIVTFSWHPRNPVTGGDSWDTSTPGIPAAILPGGAEHATFMTWLERLGDFLAGLDGTPVVFRPWHENLGGWFWWGTKCCTADEYKALFVMTYDYLVGERRLDNLLWCYSPNGDASPEAFMGTYPGDEYIDIVGADMYEYAGAPDEDADRDNFSGSGFKERLDTLLAFLRQVSDERGKVAALTETGLEALPNPTWWTETLYPALESSNVAYVLTWRNAHDRPSHFYAPWAGFEHSADFVKFTEFEKIVVLK